MDYMFANDEECSSGCESGWTLYFDHSSPFPPQNTTPLFSRDNTLKKADDDHDHDYDEEEEEDEDLSMVSDASSGPPSHELDVHDSSFNPNYAIKADVSTSTKKNRENRRRVSKVKLDPDSSSSLLDDTASSPLFHFSNALKSRSTLTTNKTSSMENNNNSNVLEYSQGYGYSTTQFQQAVRPPYQQHYDDLFHSENQLQHQNQW